MILDINLPEKSGIEVCKEIRSVSDVPIIVLSARDSESDKLLLFELGVDDYVAKPFSPRELMARIAAIGKRIEARKKPKNSKHILFGTLTLDTTALLAYHNQNPLCLTKTEFSLLEYFVKHAE